MRIDRPGLVLSFVLVAVLAAAGCGRRGGGGGGGGGTTDSGTRTDGGPPPGGGSGVARTKLARELTTSEATQFCAWLIAQYGGEGVVTMCADGIEITSPTMAECVDQSATIPDSCPMTVGDTEDCFTAIAADPCVLVTGPPAVCDGLAECATASP